MISNKSFAALAIALATLLCLALSMLGGPFNRLDNGAITALSAERAMHPFLVRVGIWVSFAGAAPVTTTVTLFAAAFLVWRGRVAHAAMLLAVVLSGRLLVDYLKIWIGRPRPDLEMHAVTVQSLSFPSGHAANSMVAFVAAALFCAPQRHRRAALTIAIAASVLVGLSRPLLGVHWPSDVLAGWVIGLLWSVGWWHLTRRFDATNRA